MYYILLHLVSFVLFYSTTSTPIFNETYDLNNTTDTNNTNKDLLVIKTVVYEVGILTEADENVTSPEESEERIDLTFYNPERNGNLFNLSNIGNPIETNFSVLSLTDLTPIKSNTTNDTNGYLPLNVPYLPNLLFGNLFNVSTSNATEMKEIIRDAEEIEDEQGSFDDVFL